MTLLSLKHLSFAWPAGPEVLRDVSFEVAPGERICLMGRNGSGKSTLFRLIVGLEEPKSGELYFQGEPYSYKKKWLTDLRKQIGFVFQDPEEQLFAPSVFQELGFGLLNLGVPEDEVRARVLETAERTGLTPLLERPTHLLSFGEKKRVTIAGILVMRPKLLLLDEPTAWLDPENQAEITDLLLRMNEEGVTLIVSSHQLAWARQFGERAIFLGHGEVAYDGPMADTFEQREMLEDLGLWSRFG